MDKDFDLAIIQALAAGGAYGGERTISANTAALLMCAAVYISNLKRWQGVGHTLTADEIDTIEAMVAQAVFDISDGEDIEVGDCVKIAEAVATTDSADLEIDNFVSGTFHTYKLIIQGLKTDDDGAYVDHLGIEFNDDAVAAHYSTLCRIVELDNYVRYEHLGTVGFFQSDWFCSTITGNAAAIGHAEFTIYDPQGDDFKSIVGNGFVNNFDTCNVLDVFMRGVFLSGGEITKIRIFPVLGTQFKVAPASASYPSELRMTLYGLK